MATYKILLTDGLEENGQVILRANALVDNNPTITADDLLKVVGEYFGIEQLRCHYYCYCHYHCSFQHSQECWNEQ